MVRVIAAATTRYRGNLTKPERWSTWDPREGDVLVCTPPKSGTTWTQTMLAMLLNGGPDLPDSLGVISPWVDADLGVDPNEVSCRIASLPGRRVLKTHTPADGFPVWEGVRVVAVYRHPLDLFFSLRKHMANRHLDDDEPMKAPVSEALAAFLDTPMDKNDFDRDTLENVVHHYACTVSSRRIPGLVALHYSDLITDPHRTIRRLADAVDINTDDRLIDTIASATTLQAMRSKADRFAPVGGTGFWKRDADFFATGGAGNWIGKLEQAELAAYDERLRELLPDDDARNWLEQGTLEHRNSQK